MFVTVKARVYTDVTGAYAELPALLTPAGVLEPLLDYCLHRSVITSYSIHYTKLYERLAYN